MTSDRGHIYLLKFQSHCPQHIQEQSQIVHLPCYITSYAFTDMSLCISHFSLAILKAFISISYISLAPRFVTGKQQTVSDSDLCGINELLMTVYLSHKHFCKVAGLMSNCPVGPTTVLESI